MRSRFIPPALAIPALTAALLAAAPAGAATTVKAVPAAVTAMASGSGACVHRLFSYGSSGDCVADIQQMLNDQIWLAFDSGYRGTYISVSGWFGPITASQVRYFQWKYRLGVDGVAGPRTWRSLCMAAWDSGDTTSYYGAGC